MDPHHGSGRREHFGDVEQEALSGFNMFVRGAVFCD